MGFECGFLGWGGRGGGGVGWDGWKEKGLLEREMSVEGDGRRKRCFCIFEVRSRYITAINTSRPLLSSSSLFPLLTLLLLPLFLLSSPPSPFSLSLSQSHTLGPTILCSIPPSLLPFPSAPHPFRNPYPYPLLPLSRAPPPVPNPYPSPVATSRNEVRYTM